MWRIGSHWLVCEQCPCSLWLTCFILEWGIDGIRLRDKLWCAAQFYMVGVNGITSSCAWKVLAVPCNYENLIRKYSSCIALVTVGWGGEMNTESLLIPYCSTKAHQTTACIRMHLIWWSLCSKQQLWSSRPHISITITNVTFADLRCEIWE